MKYIETSAKTGENIEELFVSMAEDIQRMIENKVRTVINDINSSPKNVRALNNLNPKYFTMLNE